VPHRIFVLSETAVLHMVTTVPQVPQIDALGGGLRLAAPKDYKEMSCDDLPVE
jgi:hypothetical protein